MKTLDLVLKHKWYDMIECGEKREEYREIKPYWQKRLMDKDYTLVRFHRGYTNTTMLFIVSNIKIGYGNPHWGAPYKDVFKIELGERIL